MYEFIRLQYRMGRLNPEQVKAFAPQWLTTEQAETIINNGESR
ncbi:MAG TPA: XkdX family protein [Candidatus Avoscillospira avistercoris]|uniref:XkdX family protein n=1 Tax=Candidatus Avoscillospira avistercoris TaxID=2840707 RepID=A0A9D1JT48_9FIRM|nr:XkdX family protein [Candidatus Avoscillospira avistercoris]